MIISFRGKEARRIWQRRRTRLPPGLWDKALMKLTSIHVAKNQEDLRNPPSNRLKALGGDRKGQYSIRINDQWRICFVWDGMDAHDVEIVDYH